jgi:hypothetical protein
MGQWTGVWSGDEQHGFVSNGVSTTDLDSLHRDPVLVASATVEKQGLVLQRGGSDFRLAVDRELSALYQDGDMARIFRSAMPGIEPGVAQTMLFVLAPEVF